VCIRLKHALRAGTECTSPGEGLIGRRRQIGRVRPGHDERAGAHRSALKSGSLLTVLPIFFVLGLLLSFTPCVLPMLPILSSIIVGQSARQAMGGNHGLTRDRGFVLALAYSLGMAIVYTALGIAAGLPAKVWRARLQQPAYSDVFSALLVALRCPMFGFYDLRTAFRLANSPRPGSGRRRRRQARRRVCGWGDQRPYRGLGRCTVGRDLALHLATRDS